MGPQDPLSRLRGYLETQAQPGLVSAYLFGSHAEGRAHRESDVDVAVLLDRAVHPQPRDRFEKRVRLGSELIHVLGVNDVDLVILNDAPPGLGRAIVSRGERIYCADDAADHAYVRDVQLLAADLAPFLQRTRRIKLEALRS